MLRDYANHERQRYLAESAHKHLRIVRLWRKVNTPEFRFELFWIFVVGLIVGEWLARAYG